MEIEKEEEYSTCSEFDTDSKSLNSINDPLSKPLNNFINEINSLKYKIYEEQFISIFTKYNIDVNNIYILISNYANLNTKINYDEYIHYSEKLLTQIYNIKYFLKENKIEEIINEIKSINKNILNNYYLLFIIHRQKLLYLIKRNLVNDSLVYAQKYILPLTENNDMLYSELGNVMSLLAYENINDCPDKELLDKNGILSEKVEEKIIFIIIKFLISKNN